MDLMNLAVEGLIGVTPIVKGWETTNQLQLAGIICLQN